ncbi:MAG: hypothetical protein K0S07_1406 [Chlamydiales bacterium]|jgi:hypothetical protein|nr:hypothetical protein [Chlamydiales bacterium]
MHADVRLQLKKLLGSQYACYVLIACGHPKEDEMDVEMAYEGDPVLASYLVDTAQSRIDEEAFGSLDEEEALLESKIQGFP